MHFIFRHSDEGLQSETSVFLKFIHYGIKFINLITCKTVSLETLTQHSIYDLETHKFLVSPTLC